MKYFIAICLSSCLLFSGCESDWSGQPSGAWEFNPYLNYGDPYLNSTAMYVRMLQNWDYDTQGAPPPPQQPSQMHTGSFPSPSFGNPFMQGYADGAAAGAQAGAIRLQSARNQAYSVALNHYYSKLASSRSNKTQD